MKLGIAAIGCALALALVVLPDSQAQADGMARKVYRQTRCVVPARMWMSQVAWSCRRDQKCCYDWVARRGNCVAASERCF
jgi:hypothetical protein